MVCELPKGSGESKRYVFVYQRHFCVRNGSLWEGHTVVTADSWNGLKILITGASGFLGRHLYQLLIRNSVTVCPLAYQSNRMLAPDMQQMDICDRDSLFELIELFRPDAVVHLAAAGVTRSNLPLSRLLQINVLGTENLLAAVTKFSRHTHVVLVGTGYEYRYQSRPVREDDPLLPVSAYAVSKCAAGLCASIYAQENPVTLLRLFNTYGPGEPQERLLPYMVNCARDGVPVDLTGCEQVRDFTFVTDVVEAFWSVLKSPPTTRELRILNVGSGRPVPLKQFVNTAVRVLEECGYLPRVVFGARPYRHEDPVYCVADTSQMLKATGFQAHTDINEGIERTVKSLLGLESGGGVLAKESGL